MYDFHEWVLKKDELDDFVGPLQALPGPNYFDVDKFACDLCRGTRDEKCEVCTGWAEAVSRHG
eukprot:COSAG06_NODE_17115_length_960_cov_1.250871_1_plen_62_part_10